jgi:saccharopine dehydrogenase (NAD+, L-lysine-forming)
VGSVVAHKCAQNPEIFSNILLASRTFSKCEQIKKTVNEKTGIDIQISKVNANKKDELIQLINNYRPDVLVNAALPYQNLTVMDACLETGIHYLDTASSEIDGEVEIDCFTRQLAYHQKFINKGITAVLSVGFDPGVTNVFTAYAKKHLFDEIHYLDIVDCNAGDHGMHFATNFNAEINLKEFLLPSIYWENGELKEKPPITNPNCTHFTFNYPIVGPQETYLLYHEEVESIAKNIDGIKRVRFWMTFSEKYLQYLRVLHNIGLTRLDEVTNEGKKIIPIKLLKSLLPDPSTLAKNYTGKTVIGNIITGIKDGSEKTVFIYNVCDHRECYKEVGSQAISYTTGVPAMIGSEMIMTGIWQSPGVYNAEQLEPDVFMEKLNIYGLPWKIVDYKKLPDNI